MTPRPASGVERIGSFFTAIVDDLTSSPGVIGNVLSDVVDFVIDDEPTI